MLRSQAWRVVASRSGQLRLGSQRQTRSASSLAFGTRANRLLVLNAGSSSLKYKVFGLKNEGALEVEAQGLVEKIGEDHSRIVQERTGGETTQKEARLKGHLEALRAAFELLGLDREDFFAVGHRVVQGADKITGAVRITPAVKQIIRELKHLAPLHNPNNLLAIEGAEAVLGDEIPQVAVFDTAFHHTIPEEAYLYGVPYDEVYKKFSCRRYGYHGSSYAYLLKRAAKLLSRKPTELNAILCHLGAGASIACIMNGRSIDTTMGMTPTEGLVMNTRSGDIDPGAVLYLASELGVQEIDTILNRRSGMLGLCGQQDMREVLRLVEAGDSRATVALEVYLKRIQKYIGAYFCQLAPEADVLVFSGGVGERSAPIRRKIGEKLQGIQILIDPERNTPDLKEGPIHHPDSCIDVLVVPTDEERQIAEETMEIVAIKR